MKHSLFLSILAATLLGGQVFAGPVVYKVSDYQEVYTLDPEATLVVDVQKNLQNVAAFAPNCLTLDYQGNFVLTASGTIDTPDEGVLNITSSVSSVATAWENAFSVEGGDSITLCHAGSKIDEWRGSVQFFSTDANNTVQLGDSEVLFKGLVASKDALAMNEVGLVWTLNDLTLVGKLEAPAPVPEPTTGTLSLLALAGLCARRRRK